jgi:HSP20 family protein
MAVIRYEPFRDPFDRLMALAGNSARTPLSMPLDVYRSEDGNYHVEADLPGIEPDSLEVTIEHSTLTMRGERSPHYADKGRVLSAERPQGTFSRQLALGEGVDAEHLTAAYTDGVLTVMIPASPKVQPRRIEVEHSSASRTVSGAKTG